MEYRILSDELRYPDRVSETYGFKKHSSNELYVRDDYADDINFGFCEGDVFSAFAHAELMIERLYGQKVPNKNDEDCLIQDVKNYILCMPNANENSYANLMYLIRALAYFNLHEQLYALVLEHYREYEEERKDGIAYSVPLDFQELYGEIGDYLLFGEGQPGLAIKMYQLATLEWIEPSDSIYYEEYNEKKENEWIQHCREYQYFWKGNVRKIRRKRADNSEESNCIRLYNRILSNLQPSTSMIELMSNLNRFYEEVQQVMERVWDKHSQRKVLIMAHRVREKTLMHALADLNDKDSDTQNQYWKLVLLRVTESRFGSLEIVREYIRQSGKRIESTFSLYLRVLELAKLILCVDIIKFYLLANDGKQDIAYYTSLKTFEYMLPKEEENPSLGKLSVMHMAYMNDPTEGKMLRRYLVPEHQEIDVTENGRRVASYPYVFMKCFTTLIDDLPMWEMYGNHAAGCCLVLHKGYFSRQDDAEQSIPLYRVCYLRKERTGIEIKKEDNLLIDELDKVRTCLQWIKDTIERNGSYKKWYLAAVEDIVYLFKDADYHHEQELRIVYQFRKPGNQFQHTPEKYPKLYIRPEFYPKIKEIILGPKFEGRAEKMPYLQEQIAKMCEEIGSTIPVCSMSAIEYR